MACFGDVDLATKLPRGSQLPPSGAEDQLQYTEANHAPLELSGRNPKFIFAFPGNIEMYCGVEAKFQSIKNLRVVR